MIPCQIAMKRRMAGDGGGGPEVRDMRVECDSRVGMT